MPVVQNGEHHEVIFFPSASVAGNRLAPDPQYPGIVNNYRNSFAVLKKIDADIYLAPHAEFFDLAKKPDAMGVGKPNPFIKPGELHTAVLEFESDFNAALAKQMRGAK